jgi:acetyl-CoA carboxylase carboxyltransferase component
VKGSRPEASGASSEPHVTALARLEDLERRADAGGGEDRQRRQRESGKLTARERIELLFDTGTF